MGGIIYNLVLSQCAFLRLPLLYVESFVRIETMESVLFLMVVVDCCSSWCPGSCNTSRRSCPGTTKLDASRDTLIRRTAGVKGWTFHTCQVLAAASCLVALVALFDHCLFRLLFWPVCLESFLLFTIGHALATLQASQGRGRLPA